jgi:hypothetical protein
MQVEIGQHADEERAERYAMGMLPDQEAAAFEEHLLVCHTCLDRLEETDAYVEAMRGAALALRARRNKWRAALAAIFDQRKPVWVIAMGALFALALAGVRWRLPPGAGDAPVAISLAASRGANSQAPAGKRLLPRLDLTDLPELPAYRVQIVDRLGRPVWGLVAAPQDGHISMVTRRFATGMYYARVYAPPQDLVREYGLHVE